MRIFDRVLTLSLPDGDGLPGEFRIFTAGLNTSTKGDVLFDEKAAASVMAEYRRHGVDVHIDLEHQALDPESVSYDPDARGWAKLELRNGELWAVDVRWTTDGAHRLREKTQRYVSPAFRIDNDNRVTSIVNVALTGLPATHQTAALVAANRLERRTAMTPELVKKLLAAIEGDDKDAALALCKDMLVAQATGDDAGAGGDESGGESDDDAAGNADALSNAGAEDDKDEEAMRAASVKLCALTGRQSVGEAVSAVENWSKRLEKIEKREATLELSARRELVAELVRLGVELPSTAWEGEPSDRKPCQRLSVEPIDALRSRVETFRAARPKLPKPPNSGGDVGGGGTMQLSQRELELCTRMKIDPKEYAINRAAIRRGKQ